MATPKRCIAAATAATVWPDGTPKSPDNAFNWDTGEPTAFNTKALKFHARWSRMRNFAEVKEGVTINKNWASMD